MKPEPKIFIVAGEHSGDLHGSGVLKEILQLNSEIQVKGYGGEGMKNCTNGEVQDWLDQAAVMGLWEVLKKYGWFKKKMNQMVQEIEDWKPDVLLLVDYPGFNLRLAEQIKSTLPNIKIIDYISPQVWAWKKGRIPKMVELIDLMICLFPFEKNIFEKAGLQTVCSGHPLLDEIPDPKPTREPNLIALLPGSRSNEINRLLPDMLKGALLLQQEFPDQKFTFKIPSASTELLEKIQNHTAKYKGKGIEFVVVEDQARDLMTKAQAGVVASGTASLESAVMGLPYILVYRLAGATFAIAKRIVKIPHVGMVNVLAQKEIVKELLQKEVTPKNIASELKKLLTDKELQTRLDRDYQDLEQKLGEKGSYKTAAQAILKEVTYE